VPLLSTRPESFGETANVIKAYGASLVAIAHQTVPDTNRKFEQENNLGFAILDDTSGIAAAAFGIGWTSECLRELFEQFSTDRTGFNPEVAAIVPMQARYVIGPDDIIAYADINVDYRSEPELSAVLLVLQRLQNATS
jgi:peroxiredoxin